MFGARKFRSFPVPLFGGGTSARRFWLVLFRRLAGMMLLGNWVRPTPPAPPLSGWDMGLRERALKSPRRNASVGAVARMLLLERTRTRWECPTLNSLFCLIGPPK